MELIILLIALPIALVLGFSFIKSKEVEKGSPKNVIKVEFSKRNTENLDDEDHNQAA